MYDPEKAIFMTESRFVTVQIPDEVINQLNTRLRRTEFDSVDEYITFVLEEVLAHMDEVEDDFSETDKSEVEDRLKSLGYITD